MLKKLNESLTEWLEASWAYFGMKEVKSEGDEAKKEYEYFKKICLILQKKSKKSCNRKNKKKNRKKN